MKRIGILNGPNLDRLGKREPEVYGAHSLTDLENILKEASSQLGNVEVAFFQSNHEGALIDQIAQWTDAGFAGYVINPGGLTHTSVALRDAIAGCALPCIEVHISNIYRREDFRHKTLTGGACVGVISGLGIDGYIAALTSLATG
ncbi:MAG: type II 3-dehydroquinate dehydratase [Opitutales bacterium]